MEAAEAWAAGEDSLEVGLRHLPPIDAEILKQTSFLCNEIKEESGDLPKSMGRKRNGLDHIRWWPWQCGNRVEYTADVEALELAHRDGFDGLKVLQDPSAVRLMHGFSVAHEW